MTETLAAQIILGVTAFAICYLLAMSFFEKLYGISDSPVRHNSYEVDDE
jgi:hypothetical protein